MSTINNLLVALTQVDDEGDFVEVIKSYLVPGRTKWFAVDGKHFNEEEVGLCVIEDGEQLVLDCFDALVIFPRMAYRYEGKRGAFAVLMIARNMIFDAESHAQEG